MNSNTAAVQRIYASFSAGDVSAILATLTDDVVWSCEANDRIAFGGIRKGPQETVGFFEGIAKQLDDPRLDMTEFVAEGDIVAAFGTFEATVRDNGRKVTTPVAHYFRFRAGNVAEYRNFVNTAAFADAITA